MNGISDYNLKQDKLVTLLTQSQRDDPLPWTHICPSLTLPTGLTPSTTTSSSPSSPSSHLVNPFKSLHRRRQLMRNGYVLVDDPIDLHLVSKVKHGIETLQQQGLPATLVFLYEETWQLAKVAHRVLQACSHQRNRFHFDLLAWYIPRGNAGFSPHRDRQPGIDENMNVEINPTDEIDLDGNGNADEMDTQTATREENNYDDNNSDKDQGKAKAKNNKEDPALNLTRSSFHLPDAEAKFITLWIALSEASPRNSCLYVIPKPFDPGYMDGDLDSIDPLERALPNKESYQNIRALPRSQGQSVLFTHRIIHWGSAGDTEVDIELDTGTGTDVQKQETTTAHGQLDGLGPRIAISFVSCDPDFEQPLLENPSDCFDPDTNTFPSFATRLLLVCAQLLVYYQRFDLDPQLILACYEVCKENKHKLAKAYRRKVFVEFVKAVQEAKQKAQDTTSPSPSTTEAIERGAATTINIHPKTRGTDDNDTGIQGNDISRVEHKKPAQKHTHGHDQRLGHQKNSQDVDDDVDKHKEDEEGTDDELQDKVMQEILEAEMEGYGDFHDDFDELDQDDHGDGCGHDNDNWEKDNDDEEEEGNQMDGSLSFLLQPSKKDKRQPANKKLKHI